MVLDPNEMTPNPNRHVVKPDNREQKAEDKVTQKETYRRLMKNDDFKKFCTYLETCYNSYMDAAGEPNLNGNHREFLHIQANAYRKTLEYIKRQAS